jgi:choline-sulfatase
MIMSKHPNILFLMSDEHRPDVLGYAGNEVVRTPVLDAIAADAVVFNNAYTPSPICIPARQCLACGQLPRTCKAERYGDDIPPFSMTWAKRLSQFGYATVCAGKLHHDGPDQMQGWTTRIGSDMNVEPKYIAGRDVDSFKSFRHPSSYRSRDEAGEVVRAGVGHGRYTHDRDAHALAGVKPFIQHHYNDVYADKPSGHQPLLLKVSFNRPHLPYLTTEEKINYYLNRVPIYVEGPDFEHHALNRGKAVVGEDGINERDIRKATAAYYGMVEEIDEDYGTVMHELAHVGQNLDDWWIIFTADHGSMLGQHGTWSKGKFYEGSVRVPLMIRPPLTVREQWGMTPGQTRFVDQNVNTCDLFTTICEMANVPLPEKETTVLGAGLDSRSLMPLMQCDGPVPQWDDETISQFAGKELMIKRGSLKYQFYENAQSPLMREVLFDLEADLSERMNLIGESRYATELDGFRARCVELGFGDQADAHYRNAGYN